MAWLPEDFVHPLRVELTTGHYIRPITGADLAIDFPAVMGSRERLWSIFGNAWGWPPASLTIEQDHAELVRHAREIEAHESFNYCILDKSDSELLGCIYIDPPEPDGPSHPGTDCEVCWWVVDKMVGSDLETLLLTFVPAWLADSWPFTDPRIGLPD